MHCPLSLYLYRRTTATTGLYTPDTRRRHSFCTGGARLLTAPRSRAESRENVILCTVNQYRSEVGGGVALSAKFDLPAAPAPTSESHSEKVLPTNLS